MKINTQSKAIAYCFIVMLSLAITSCQKDNNSDVKPPEVDTYHVRAKIDGVNMEFNTSVYATDTFMSPRYTLFIQGQNASRTAHLSVYIASFTAPIKEGDSFVKTLTDSSGMTGIVYNTDMQDPTYQAMWVTYPVYKYTGSELDIKILEMNSEFVRGTFSGRVYPKNESTTYKTVTNGSFKAKLN